MWWQSSNFTRGSKAVLEAAFRQNRDEIASGWQCLNYLVRLPVGSNHVPLAVPDKHQQYFHSGSVISHKCHFCASFTSSVLLSPLPWDTFIREPAAIKTSDPPDDSDWCSAPNSNRMSPPIQPPLYLDYCHQPRMVGNMHREQHIPSPFLFQSYNLKQSTPY